ncbi:hypothetical protein B0H11DRAFT_117097 [Mycena galericulata]|nr:hypothetical protein B0H11DRAFT_117097 [Mycena galericulata]
MSPRTTPQGVNSSTFHPAPFDHDLSIPELYEHHALHSPTHAAFMYSDVDTGTTKFVTYDEAWLGIRQAAAIVSQHLFESGSVRSTPPNQPPVIAVLALSDTLSSIYMLVGIMSLGLTSFPMSPRNSAEATADLLKKTGALCMFTNKEGPINALAKEAASLLSNDGVELDLLTMPNYEALTQKVEAPDAKIIQKVHGDDVVLILHSSGRIYVLPLSFTNYRLIQGLLLSPSPCIEYYSRR